MVAQSLFFPLNDKAVLASLKKKLSPTGFKKSFFFILRIPTLAFCLITFRVNRVMWETVEFMAIFLFISFIFLLLLWANILHLYKTATVSWIESEEQIEYPVYLIYNTKVNSFFTRCIYMYRFVIYSNKRICSCRSYIHAHFIFSSVPSSQHGCP